MESPAGMPSRMTISARPCDSPAVRNRTIEGAIVYEISAAFGRRVARASRHYRDRTMRRRLCTRARRVMTVIVSDRFALLDDQWTDLASGSAVSLPSLLSATPTYP